jgi:uncharacterized protein (DUF58 family)
VGLLVFAHEPILFIPAEKGSRHLLRMIREILVAKPEKPGTSVAEACDFLVRTLRRKSVVFLISDFFSDPLDKPLGKLAKKHESIALRVMDPLEATLPKAGKVVMIDPETGFETLVNTSNPNLRMGYAKLMARQQEGVAAVFKKHGIDAADLYTNGDTLAALHRLLKKRSRRRSG